MTVFSVADKEEARSLIVLSCRLGYSGDYIAPELVEKQTLANLRAFSDRLAGRHDLMKKHGKCRCKEQAP